MCIWCSLYFRVSEKKVVLDVVMEMLISIDGHEILLRLVAIFTVKQFSNLARKASTLANTFL